MNITDAIAQVILSTLEDSGGTVQIQRNELANKIGCVPSQINYVITSRFTPEQGYIVESKRGGGGYIKIIKIQSGPETTLMHLINSIGDSIDENSVRVMLQNLCYDNILTEKDAKMILSAVTDHVLKAVPSSLRGKIRSAIFKSMLLNIL